MKRSASWYIHLFLQKKLLFNGVVLCAAEQVASLVLLLVHVLRTEQHQVTMPGWGEQLRIVRFTELVLESPALSQQIWE